MKLLLADFKAFALKGNVLDMAVGVIIGAAFSKIVTSLVNDLLLPPVGLALGKTDFKSLFIALDGKSYLSLEAAKQAAAPILAYGNFLQTMLDFVVVAAVIFLILKRVLPLVMRPKGATAIVPTTRPCPECLSEIPVKAKRCSHCTVQVAPTTA
jgi:large conductance mechanosensitive channel